MCVTAWRLFFQGVLSPTPRKPELYGYTLLTPTEPFRLLKDCQQKDILLVEDVDRLSRLTGVDGNTLKKLNHQKDSRVMAVNVPTT